MAARRCRHDHQAGSCKRCKLAEDVNEALRYLDEIPELAIAAADYGLSSVRSASQVRVSKIAGGGYRTAEPRPGDSNAVRCWLRAVVALHRAAVCLHACALGAPPPSWARQPIADVDGIRVRFWDAGGRIEAEPVTQAVADGWIRDEDLPPASSITRAQVLADTRLLAVQLRELAAAVDDPEATWHVLDSLGCGCRWTRRARAELRTAVGAGHRPHRSRPTQPARRRR